MKKLVLLLMAVLFSGSIGFGQNTNNFPAQQTNFPLYPIPPEECEMDGDVCPPECPPDGGGECSEGMAIWSVRQPNVTLWIKDTPLFYYPAHGTKVAFKLTFQHENDEAANSAFWVGPKWGINWRSYIVDNLTLETTVRPGPSGTQRRYTPNGSTREPRSRSTLTRQTNPLGQLTGYVVNYPSGAKEIYGYVVNAFSGASAAAFLTQRIDAWGNTNTFNYTQSLGNVLLTSVVDADGKTNTIRYTNGSFPKNITEVEDPYGRITTLQYDSSGRLTNVIDTVGIASGFKYDSSNVITNLVTPYGATSFKFFSTNFAITGAMGGSNDVNRAIFVTHPTGAKELFMYRDNSMGLNRTNDTVFLFPPSNPDTSAFTNSFFSTNWYYRNSYHWNRQQYAALSSSFRSSENFNDLTVQDYKISSVRHWARQPGTNAVSATLSWERKPSPNGSLEGHYIYYDYDGQSSGGEEAGTKALPRLVAEYVGSSVRFTFHERTNANHQPNMIVSTFTGPSGIQYRTNRYEHAANGIDLIKILGPAGETEVSLGYNSNHQVLKITNGVSEVTTFTYDSKGRLTSILTPEGLTTTNLYFSSGTDTGRLQKQIQLEINRTNQFSYINGYLQKHTNELGLVTTFAWDGLGRVTGVSFPDGTSISNRYSIASAMTGGNGTNLLQRTATKDRLGNWTYFAYNPFGQITHLTNALSKVWTLDYCECGDVSTVLDPLNNVTTFYRDFLGRATNVVGGDGKMILYTYTAQGDVASVTPPGQSTITYQYNIQGLPTLVFNSQGTIEERAYDIENRLTNRVDINGVGFSQAFDNLDRVVTRTWANGAVEGYFYSTNIHRYTNQLTDVTWYVYDKAKRLSFQTNANNKVLKFTYDAAGNLKTLTDEKNQVTTWKYNEYGWLTNKLDHNNGTVFNFAYNANRWLTNRYTPAKGNTVYRYDLVGNLTNVDYAVSGDLVFKYDAANRLTNMVDAVGTTSFSFNEVGQMLSEDGPWGSDKVSYEYDVGRFRTGISVEQFSQPHWVQTYEYLTHGRLDRVTSPAGIHEFRYKGNEWGNSPSPLLETIIFPSGAAVTNRYDELARLTNTTLHGSAGMSLNSHAYEYNNANLVTKQTRVDDTYVNYTYDKLFQLKTATGKEPGGTDRLQEKFGYNYDDAGNLINRTNNALVQTISVNSLNQLSSASRSGTFTAAGVVEGDPTNVTVNGSAVTPYADKTFAKSGISLADGNNTITATAQDANRTDSTSVTVNLPATVSFTYDSNGNLTGDGRRTFAYDDENQLASVTISNSIKTEYAYDGFGRKRIQKEFSWSNSAWVQTNEIRYVYDGMLSIQERHYDPRISTVLPQKTVSYTRGNDKSGTIAAAGGIGGLLARTESSGSETTHNYYHCDLGGNITALFSSDEKIVAHYIYDPFGNTIRASGPLAEENALRFSSKEYDPRNDLYYYGYRFYDPHLQRWLNRDPICELGGINLYTFVENGVPVGLDPFGLTSPGTLPLSGNPVLGSKPGIGPKPLNPGAVLTTPGGAAIQGWTIGWYTGRAIGRFCPAGNGQNVDQRVQSWWERNLFPPPPPELTKPSERIRPTTESQSVDQSTSPFERHKREDCPIFYHYTDLPNLTGQGLLPNSWVTNNPNLPYDVAIGITNLEYPERIYVYPVMVPPGTPIDFEEFVHGLPQWRLPIGTPIGTILHPQIVPKPGRSF